MTARSNVVSDVPERIGKHQVLGFLASGGMAEIFLGREPSSGQPVVIKRILPHLARQSSFVSMFIDEARIGTMIRHPNVVETYELGQVGHDLFMVMEHLAGENLASLLRRLVVRDERLAYGLATHVVAEACLGLHAAHQLHDAGHPLGLVHRDVSLHNVFVTYDGAVKVLDFGIATATHRLSQTATGQLKGKFSYMSPEQCRGEPLDARSDVFSLGIVLYELTMQRRLFARSNEMLVLKAVCEAPVPHPSRDRRDYPAFLEEICLRALDRDRDRRYASAQQMHDDLVVQRQLLLGDADPRELLATEMHRLFEARVAEKRQMLQHVRAGTDLGVLPSTEADEGVVVPVATQSTGSALPSVVEAIPGRRPPRRVRRVLSAVAIALVACGGVIAVPAVRDQVAAGIIEPQPPARARPAAAPTVAASPQVAAIPLPAVPSEVVVLIESTPAGAHLTIDGAAHGVTPHELRLAPGAAPVELELRRRGYATVRQTVDVDRDQRLVLALRKHDRARGGPPVRSGFHRFD